MHAALAGQASLGITVGQHIDQNSFTLRDRREMISAGGDAHQACAAGCGAAAHQHGGVEFIADLHQGPTGSCGDNQADVFEADGDGCSGGHGDGVFVSSSCEAKNFVEVLESKDVLIAL